MENRGAANRFLSFPVYTTSGRQVLNALENSVSQYPSLEGRFPQTAGVKFAFDPTKPAGNRIDPRYVRIQGEYMVLDNVSIGHALSHQYALLLSLLYHYSCGCKWV